MQQWNSRVSINSNAIASSHNQSPMLEEGAVNGLSALRFDGESSINQGDWMEATLDITLEKTMFVVFREEGGTEAPSSCCTGLINTGNDGFNGIALDQGLPKIDFSSTNDNFRSSTRVTNAWTLAVVTMDSNFGLILYLNGSLDVSVTSQGAQDAESLIIGARDPVSSPNR